MRRICWLRPSRRTTSNQAFVSVSSSRLISGRGARTFVESDSAPQTFDLLFRRHALDLHLVDLADVVARRRDVVRQLAVVRQDEQTFRVEVEGTDGVARPEPGGY